MSKVYKKTGTRAGESFFLRKKVVTLGRAMQCEFLFNDAGISRQHAQIEQTPQGYIIRDMNSGNGTYLRGEKIEGQAILKDRDEFALGSVLFVFFVNDNAVPEDISSSSSLNPTTALPMYRDETILAGSSADESVQIAPIATPVPLYNNNQSSEAGSQLANQKTQTKPLKGVGKAYYAQDDLMFASLVNMDMKGMLGDQVRKQNRNIAEKYAIMFKTSQVIAESIDLDSLVSKTLKLVMEIFPAKRAYLFMKDEISGDLDPYQTYPQELMQKQPAQYSKTILREIIEKKISIMTQDAEHDDQFASNQSIVMAKICSAMVVPLLVQGSIIGAIQLDSSVNAAFDGEDMDLFAAICNQAAVGINSKILTQSLTKEISQRKKVSRFHSPAVLQALMEASDEQGLEPQKKFCTIF
ncbi:MAG: FHA domain-containing protein, partial [Planctomycetota bacterium]